MAEKEEGRAPVHKRSTYSHRGHPGQNRLYSQLGVKDLRELLDRKRNEREQAGEPNVPPPDPSYSYLKDPLRESDDNNPHEHQTRPSGNNRKYHNKNSPNNNQKREKEPHAGNVSNYPRNKDIENPINIKVEFSTSTGEHVYKMDETTILPTIKHVPDRLPPQNRSFRGRGRGRGRGQQRVYQTRTIRSNNLDKRTPRNNISEDKQTPTEDIQPVLSHADENWGDELNQNQTIENEDFVEEGTDNSPAEEQHLPEAHVEDSLETGIQNLNIDESKPQNEDVKEEKGAEESQEKKE